MPLFQVDMKFRWDENPLWVSISLNGGRNNREGDGGGEKELHMYALWCINLPDPALADNPELYIADPAEILFLISRLEKK